MIHTTNVPLTLWAKAINTATYVLNHSSNTQVYDKTPYELWHGVKPKVHHYRIFGTIAYIFIDKSKRSKFDPKAELMVFVGYSNVSKAWRFWRPGTRSIIESADTIFNENHKGKNKLIGAIKHVTVCLFCRFFIITIREI